MTEEQPRIAEAVGTAHHDVGPDLGDAIQEAMAQVVHDISAECEEIWANDKMELEEKQRLIAEKNDPDEIRRRKLEVRDKLNQEPE